MRTSAMILFFASSVLATAFAPTIADADDDTTIAGRILDSNGGLPVSSATVELERGQTIVATAKTSSDGAFSFAGETPGVYTILVIASGYQTTRATDVYVLAGQNRIEVQTAIDRVATGLKTIGDVKVASRSSLQTTTTIEQHLDASVLQNQDYLRAGDALATVPFVNGKTASSLGAGLTLSIRGFNSTETATLLDGHPIGPIGARGNGFDFGVSPFWGLGSMDVTFGSGATGMYGVPTIAGSINFQTINPTRKPGITLTQGLGNYGTLMSGFQATGYAGKLGYAVAYGVQGTDGQIGSANILQTALLTSPSASCPSGVNSTPSIRAVDVYGCTYRVSGAQSQRNGLLKLTYDLDPKTALTLTAYNATLWDDSTGNGDVDNNPYAYILYNAQTSLAKNGNKNTVKLPGGGSATCTGSLAVLDDSAARYRCLGPQQYAGAFSGPFGGGVGRYHGARNEDYHARITRRLGESSLIVDGFVDNYGFENAKSQTKGFDDVYRTNGFLVSDSFTLAQNNDLSLGIYYQHQQHTGSQINKGILAPIKQLDLATTNYFVRDAYTISRTVSTFADLSLQRSHDTGTSTFNPRVSLVYRPTPRDVLRVTGGRSSSEPDPSLLYGPFTFVASQSYNPSCGATLSSIGSGSSPLLKPESANDVEIAYGHRFSQQLTFQANAYRSREQNPLVSGVFPLSVVPAGQMLSATDLQPYLNKLNGPCGGGYTAGNLGVSTTFNAGSATYSGIGLNATVGLARNVKAEANYAIQSAAYYGIPDSILKNNVTLINGGQFPNIPLHQATLGLGYANPTGVAARIDGFYVGANNFFNRGAYAYANLNASRTVGPLTLNLGVRNLFDSIAQQYGYVGLGTFVPENSFGKNRNSFDQGSEQFGLPYRQFRLSLTWNNGRR